jgi:hypothetical protein
MRGVEGDVELSARMHARRRDRHRVAARIARVRRSASEAIATRLTLGPRSDPSRDAARRGGLEFNPARKLPGCGSPAGR